jgi:PAS domain S-box-containing protein
MKRFLNRLLDVPSSDPSERRRSRLLNVLLLGVAAITLLAIVATIHSTITGIEETRERTLSLYAICLAMLIGVVVISAINRYWSSPLAGWLFLLLLTVVFAFSDKPQEVVAGRALFMFAIPILMASVLLRPGASFVMAALIGLLLNTIALKSQLVPNLFAVLGFFAIAMVSWLSARSLEHALQDLNTTNRELSLLYRSGQVFNATLDLKQVLVAVQQEIRDLLNATACSIWLSDLETGELVCRQISAVSSETTNGHYLALAEALARRAAHSGGSLIVPDTKAEKRHDGGQELRSVLCVPLRGGENVLGVIEVAATTVDHFGATDLKLVEALAASAAVAIEKANLYELAWREIAERKQAEEALRKAHAQNKQLLVSIPSILIGVGPDDRISHWNAPAEAAFGLAAPVAIGQPFAGCGVQWDWGEIMERIADCRQMGHSTHLPNVRYKQIDGRDGFLNIAINPFVETTPGQSGFLLLAEEITARKSLEVQLAQAQKLKATGQLAAGVAHEINTPIQYVGDNIRFLQESFSDMSRLLEEYQWLLQATKSGPVTLKQVAQVENVVEETDLAYISEQIPAAIQESLQGITRVTEIVRAMREFSHPGVREKTAIDINRAIESTITVARNEWKYVAEIETHLDNGLPLVPCLPGEFNQAILNVLVNAVHAIADARDNGFSRMGLITIATRRTGDWVEIRIGDTGPGIPEEIRPRIFDLFFTTKQVGRGTGQGLAIAHNVIVEKHDGVITFETEVGKGTTFIIRLPLALDQIEKG